MINARNLHRAARLYQLRETRLNHGGAETQRIFKVSVVRILRDFNEVLVTQDPRKDQGEKQDGTEHSEDQFHFPDPPPLVPQADRAITMMAVVSFFLDCFDGGHGSPCVLSCDRYLLTIERIIERMSMIENAIKKMRSHFVVLDSAGLVGLFFWFLVIFMYLSCAWKRLPPWLSQAPPGLPVL